MPGALECDALRVHFRSAKSAVIAALLQHDQLSRSELSDSTGVSPAAITDVTQTLLQQGLLAEGPSLFVGRRRGRPTVQLSLKASHSCFVGISVGENDSPLVLTDLQGQILDRQSLPAVETPAALASAVKTGFADSLRASGVKRSRVRGVGITVSGIVDAQSGICRYSAALDWRDVPVSDIVGSALQLPAWVDNDAKAVAVGEKLFGLAREYQDFSSVLLGRTIGSAHYMQGMLYRGHDGGAGEIGHITIDPDGATCRCGRNGCLDTVAGGAALRSAARACGLPVDNMLELEVHAAQGQTDAVRLLRSAGSALGRVVATLVHINNPEGVLFTDMEGFGNGVFRTATRQAIENGILPRFLGSTAIHFADAEPGSLPRSAASIAAFEYLTGL